MNQTTAADPALPTAAPPGSEGKILVMAERARLRISLFIDGDCEGCVREPAARHAARPTGSPFKGRQAETAVEVGVRRAGRLAARRRGRCDATG